MYPPAQEGIIQRSFGAGELAPALHARADQVKYVTGLRRCRNFIVQRAGGVTNRPGTRYTATCKTNSPSVMLLPYLSEITGESLLIEWGAGYLRFFQNGGAVNVAGVAAWSAIVTYVPGDVVSNGGVNYWAKISSLNQAPPNATFWHPLVGTLLELPHPFGADLPYYSQSGRIITLTHEAHAPLELAFQATAHWSLLPIATAPWSTPPVGLILTPGGAGTRRFAYVITAAAADTYEETVATGSVVNLGCAPPTEAAPNVLTWTALAGAAEYYVYCDPYGNGVFGYIGTAQSNSFNDIGFVADFSVTPPLTRVLFATTNNFPKVNGSHQQRRIFGYTNTTPDGVFTSRTGFPANFTISSPLQDDDALTFRMAGSQHNPVRHIVGLKSLIILTDAGEWNVKGGADGVLAPNAINADQETYVGAYKTKPVVVGNSIIYIQARGSIPRDLQFDQAVEGLGGRDLSVFSSHLVDGFTLQAMAYAQAPHSIVWFVRNDGTLLGMTYLREQEVWGWHRHDTDGFFWDVCVVPEAAGDTVYFIVRRTVNGATVRYIEKLERREIVTFDTDAFFVDAGLSYSGAPVNNVVGLGHLEAKRVAIVGDGAVISNGVDGISYVVTGGTLVPALPASYSNIHVGLPYTPEIETLDLDVQGNAVRDKLKRTHAIDVLIDASSRGFKAGPDAASLFAYAPPLYEPAADSFTGQVEMNLQATFTKYGRVFIRQPDPLPLTILGVIPHVELGG